MKAIEDIERAIEALSPEELTELYTWLDRRFPQAIDVRLKSDFAAERLDKAIQHALDDEKNGRIRPL